MKLIALNLPRDLSEQSLALIFKKIGDIKSCTLVIDKYTGISKGFGFVEMALDLDGETAINELDGTKIGKNKIRIKQSTDQ
jgi:RNA recognition motif-containing protein